MCIRDSPASAAQAKRRHAAALELRHACMRPRMPPRTCPAHIPLPICPVQTKGRHAAALELLHALSQSPEKLPAPAQGASAGRCGARGARGRRAQGARVRAQKARAEARLVCRAPGAERKKERKNTPVEPGAATAPLLSPVHRPSPAPAASKSHRRPSFAELKGLPGVWAAVKYVCHMPEEERDLSLISTHAK